ncbi:MAG: glycosyltransferase [Alphaproteobacteria bacterium]|nr:glycosyltransferase [Alphaproteobacteria bacterium]
MLISVCICTFKRPSVADTLESIAAQVLPAGVQTEIVVVDNDAVRSAEATVGRQASSAFISVKYAVEPVQNIALARNRALALAAGEWLAFIDDDEVADPNWLATLLSAAQSYCADVVIGRVQAVYPIGTPQWLRRADPLSRNWGPTGTIRATGSTANALLNRNAVLTGGVRFDKAFGRTGGEDTDFFNRLHLAGLQIVVANEAIVRERIMPERLHGAYLRRRAVRAGHSYALIRLRALTPVGQFGFFAVTSVKVLAFVSASVIFLVLVRAIALKFRIRGWLNFGKLRACIGAPLPNMY